MQALALAGGFREYAKTEEVKLLRQELGVTGGTTRTREIVLSINYKALAQGQNLHQNFVRQARRRDRGALAMRARHAVFTAVVGIHSSCRRPRWRSRPLRRP